MTAFVEKKYTIENLGCPNCAIKIESGIASLPGIQEASVNFATRILYVTMNQEQAEGLEKRMNKVVASIENGAWLTPDRKDAHTDYTDSHSHKGHKRDENVHSGSGKRRILLIAVALAAFGGGFLAEALGAQEWLHIGLFLIATLTAGFETMQKGVRGLLKLRLDENLLMTIAVVAAFIIGEYPEAALVALLFYVGEWFEDKAVDRSRGDIEALVDITPTQATKLLASGGSEKVNAEQIQVGDRILVSPFERVPLDGIVLSGNSGVNTSALTGESLPLEAEPGTGLLSGMVNGEGLLTVQVTKVFEDSAAARILEMVREASGRKGTSERFITRFATVYTPVVTLFAVLLATVPPLLGMGEFSDWLYRALVFLVASCPCALVISVPLGFFAGIGAASRRGVLVKGGMYLETLANAKAVVLDKTGTVTSGKLRVTDVALIPGAEREDVLRLAASAEVHSTHPAAQAILREVGENETITGEEYMEHPGHGVEAIIRGKRVAVGGQKLMNKLGIPVAPLPQASIYVAVDGTALAAVNVADTLRDDARETIQGLRELGIDRIVMLTGDNDAAAKRTAEQAGITEYHASLLPEDKVAMMEQIRKESGRTVFVGDGINDAPVLAAADVGVAMGFGSDAAIEAADMVLVQNKPFRLVDAVALFRKVMGVVKGNIVFSLSVKALVLILAIFGVAAMWMAVFADTGVALLAVFNSTRLLRMKERKK